MEQSDGGRLAPVRPILAAAIIATVLVLLLWPHHVDGVIDWIANRAPFAGPAARLDRRTLWWALELAGNVSLFLPVGFAIAWWRRSFVAGALVGSVLSIACEAAQTFIPARTPSLLDVACNVLGCTIGAMCALLLARVRREQAETPPAA